MKPEVTICVSCRMGWDEKRQKNLPVACVESIIKTMAPGTYRVHIGDSADSERDGTRAALQRLADANEAVRLYPYPDNPGHGVTIQRLLKTVETPWIVFCDGDVEFLHPAWWGILSAPLREGKLLVCDILGHLPYKYNTEWEAKVGRNYTGNFLYFPRVAIWLIAGQTDIFRRPGMTPCGMNFTPRFEYPALKQLGVNLSQPESFKFDGGGWWLMMMMGDLAAGRVSYPLPAALKGMWSHVGAGTQQVLATWDKQHGTFTK